MNSLFEIEVPINVDVTPYNGPTRRYSLVGPNGDRMATMVVEVDGNKWFIFNQGWSYSQDELNIILSTVVPE